MVPLLLLLLELLPLLLLPLLLLPLLLLPLLLQLWQQWQQQLQLQRWLLL